MADILEAIDLIESWTAHEAHDDLYRSAVLRQLGIIGEAAANLSDAFRAAYPEIAWRQVVAQRNNLIHGYWDTEWAMVEETETSPSSVRRAHPLLQGQMGPVTDSPPHQGSLKLGSVEAGLLIHRKAPVSPSLGVLRDCNPDPSAPGTTARPTSTPVRRGPIAPPLNSRLTLLGHRAWLVGGGPACEWRLDNLHVTGVAI